MSDRLLDQIVRAEIIVASVPGLLFVILYQIRVKWWRTAIGRMLMSFIGSLECILLLTVLSVFWPDMPGRPYLRVVVWAIIIASFTYMLVAFLRTQQMLDEFEKSRRK